MERTTGKMRHLNRITRDTCNPNLSSELQDAIRFRMAFLFVRGDAGFVLKPQAEDGVIGVLVWVGCGDGGAPERHLPEVKRLALLIWVCWLPSWKIGNNIKRFIQPIPKSGTLQRQQPPLRGLFNLHSI